MMTVKWKKTDEQRPSFAIANDVKLVILYGKIAVYFYDKAGKQLDVKDGQHPAEAAPITRAPASSSAA